jgi:hypothetical protein
MRRFTSCCDKGKIILKLGILTLFFHSETAMSDKYFSKVYRGFLIQQTSKGYVVPMLPNWSKGPVPQGPFSTFGIAEHIIDRVLNNG